jgi:hypothetical protein
MSRRDRIAAALLEHTYDLEYEECVCGFSATSAANSLTSLAAHVADQVEAIL